jgi:outer membrane receptor protein involved in Fe transport
VRFQRRWLSASATLFRTNFDNQFYNFQDVNDPRLFTTFQADLSTTGVELDATLKPVPWFSLDFQGVFQRPKLNNLRIGGVAQGSAFDGNRPERTPDTLFTITPAFQLPDNKGQIYGRYKRIGRIFADSGNALALPAYGVTSVGFSYNLTNRMTVQFDAENIFNVIGLTEGNPRQGQVQNVVNGLFYARGIVGPTYGGSITMRF